MRFIILMGVVSLFGDITYEGARSINGPFLATLGASAVAVGFVTGLGEFLGYVVRLLSGYLSDKTKSYWTFTIIGYTLVLSVPLLGFANYWQTAALLIIMERFGKAVRCPSRDAILSYATKQVGRGWGFGLHEAMDQIGAVTGPLIFSLVFIFKGNYRQGFNILWIPALLTVFFVFFAKYKLPAPEKMEQAAESAGNEGAGGNRVSPAFWLYIAFIFLTVTGYMSFQLMSYHFKVKSVVTDAQIPMLYALAMAVDAVVALLIGKTYDKIGLKSVAVIPFLTLPIAFLAFAKSMPAVICAVVLWGAVMGVHETIIRAAIADLAPMSHRGRIYGIFNTAYGLSMLMGGVIMGALYDISLSRVVLFTAVLQVASLPVLYVAVKRSTGGIVQ
jgi:MFS family permease